AEELLPVRVAKRVEGLAALGETLGQPLDVAPRLVTASRRAPGTAMALDGPERRLRALAPIALDHLAHVEPFDLLREVAQPPRVAAAVARDRDRRRRPEDLLERARLEADDGAVRQQRVHQHAVAADRVHAEDHGETRRALAPDERQTSRLRLDDATLPRAGAASRGTPARLHFLEAVAGVERDEALALGVNAPPARPARHLRQLVVGQRAEPALRPLGQPLQHHGPRRHVDAEAHRLGGEDHLAEAALEEALDQPLEARQDAGVVQAEAQTQRPKDHLVQHRVADRRALLARLADGAVDV